MEKMSHVDFVFSRFPRHSTASLFYPLKCDAARKGTTVCIGLPMVPSQLGAPSLLGNGGGDGVENATCCTYVITG